MHNYANEKMTFGNERILQFFVIKYSQINA